MNSAIGKFGENLERHSVVQFLPLEKLWFHIRKPFYRNHEILDAEGDTNVFSLKTQKRRYTDSLATHINGLEIILLNSKN